MRPDEIKTTGEVSPVPFEDCQDALDFMYKVATDGIEPSPDMIAAREKLQQLVDDFAFLYTEN